MCSLAKAQKAMLEDLVCGRVTIPGNHLEVAFVRSSGPGGQHVNKVSSKVELRCDFESIDDFPFGAKLRLRAIARNRLDADGKILITSQKTRDQRMNLEDARDKLSEMVLAALVVPIQRRATKPTKSSKRRRVADKRNAGAKKADRKPGSWDD